MIHIELMVWVIWQIFILFSKLNNISLGIEVPTPTVCKDIAATFLEDHNLLPAGAIFSDVGATEASAINPVTEVTRSKVLHYQVNYKMTIGQGKILPHRSRFHRRNYRFLDQDIAG